MTSQRSMQAPEFTHSEDPAVRAKREQTRRKTPVPWFKKKLFILSLALVALMMMILWAANRRGDIGTSNSQPTVSSAAKSQVVGMGTKVRDGKFEFIVTGVESPGKTLAGKTGKTLTAQGEFVIVRVNVTNIGKEALTPNCACQLLSDSTGQKFKPSSAILSTKEALKFVQLIEPGQTVKGVLVLFDVAPGTKVVNIELHDTPLSPGVKVKLS
jgi:Domain of unknown function (DUF4352)